MIIIHIIIIIMLESYLSELKSGERTWRLPQRPKWYCIIIIMKRMTTFYFWLWRQSLWTTTIFFFSRFSWYSFVMFNESVCSFHLNALLVEITLPSAITKRITRWTEPPTTEHSWFTLKFFILFNFFSSSNLPPKQMKVTCQNSKNRGIFSANFSSYSLLVFVLCSVGIRSVSSSYLLPYTYSILFIIALWIFGKELLLWEHDVLSFGFHNTF